MIVLVVDGPLSTKMKKSPSDFKVIQIENESQAVGHNVMHILQIEKRDSHRFVRSMISKMEARFGGNGRTDGVFVDPNWIQSKIPKEWV